jgi:GT2 family glycosyltransferase
MSSEPTKSLSRRATVVISTKNRKDDLRRAIASCLLQVPPVEILVLDDGSTDGTAEMVARIFPQVRLSRLDSSQGYVAQRNRGAALATTPFVVSIDDDAEFVSRHTVAQTLCEFDHPRIAAVAIPFVNVNDGPDVLSKTPTPGSPIYVSNSYVGTAHAVRRDVFLRLGGYRVRLFHQGEESDFCLRLLEHGYVTRLGNGDPIRHYHSPLRDHRRVYVQIARNSVLFAWHNVPLKALPIHLLGTTAKSLLFGICRRHPLLMLWGLAKGYAAAVANPSTRDPVSHHTYKLARRLKKAGPAPLHEIEGLLRALPSIDADPMPRCEPSRDRGGENSRKGDAYFHQTAARRRVTRP